MTGQPYRILLVDDDQVLTEMLAEFLTTEGCVVDTAGNGDLALQMLESVPADIVVLDIMMPTRGGIDTLREIRARGNLPVIMLTARGDDLDRILGLELGADDYVAKPCNPRELLARIRAVLRRSDPGSSSPEEIRAGNLVLVPSARRVTLAGRELALTQTEFDMLVLLTSHPGQLVSKSEISLQILGKPLQQWDRSIDVHISNLRRKLDQNGGAGETIRTLRGSGYLYQPAVNGTGESAP